MKFPAPRILDFDMESRPTAWYGQDRVTEQITAIGWKWIHPRGKIESALLTTGDAEDELATIMLFMDQYDEADIVTGHFIRGYDLTLLTGSLLRLGADLPSPKMSQDTKLDLVKSRGISKSQENLGAMYELKHPKIHMDQAQWRLANTLDPDGVELTRKRVEGDVREHVELRQRLLELGALAAPKLWHPRSSGAVRYVP